MRLTTSIELALALCAYFAYGNPTKERKTCIVKASGTNQTDDAPAIRAAFAKCGQHGRIVFSPTTYYVNSPMNASGLKDLDIDIHGELLVRR